ncbi:MAG: hypothetical protein QOD36_2077 [Mycobacterium sp.]|nr:hypothetical protein [Mycobacterium sp.]
MSAPFEICSKRSVVAVLASGVVISLTALTGGIAPAFAKPDTDQVVTTTAPAPEPKVQAPVEIEAPSQEAPPPKAPAPLPAPPSVESPPQTQQAVEPPAPPVAPPAPPVTQATTAPVVTAVAPASPTTAVDPPVTKVESPAPRVVAPPSSEPSSVTSTATAQSPATQSPSVPSAPASSAPASASVGSVPPSAALVPPSAAADDGSPPSSAAATPSSGSATPGSESKASEPQVSASEGSSAVTTTGGPTVSVSQAAKVIKTSEPQTLQAPKDDVELARNAKPLEVKPDPAPKQDVDAVASSIGLDLGVKGPLGIDASAKADARLASDRVRDRDIRQWSPDWVQYDEYYRPIILNPYHERVRIVYIYDNRPRIVWIPPLARAILEVAQFAAYSFTAVVETAANIVNAAVATAVNVAVGSFFGGGYVPAFGLPLPPPPPPVLRYDNVPVLVNYSNARYEPFRVRRIIDVGDDARFGERKVLLDGATPAWGVWTQTASGERQFEVHKTQQYPGLDDPQEAPLPGDYQLRLASDETSSGMSGRDIFLYVAAGVTVALGFGAIALALLLGRRRPQH